MDQALQEALRVLERGGVVCVPTESSYGLASDWRSIEGLQRIVALKGRSPNSPFALMAGSIEHCRSVTSVWPKRAEELAAKHWPGPLTLILPPIEALPGRLIGGTGGVGVRVSSCERVSNLALALGAPITATSANPAGEDAATTVAQARGYFGEGVDYYLDAGICAQRPSTLVDFDRSGQAIVLRQGPIQISTGA